MRAYLKDRRSVAEGGRKRGEGKGQARERRRSAVPELSRWAALDAQRRSACAPLCRAVRREVRHQPARAAAFIRDASARQRRRPARDPGAARPRAPQHDPAIHTRQRGAADRGVQEGSSEGVSPESSRSPEVQSPESESPESRVQSPGVRWTMTLTTNVLYIVVVDDGMSEIARQSDFCYNCGIRLTGRFCAACGQKVQELDPSLTHFLHDLTHELLHFDGKIYRSVWTLLARPGVLTRDHFEGRRARWISPIRLYLRVQRYLFRVHYDRSGRHSGSDGKSGGIPDDRATAPIRVVAFALSQTKGKTSHNTSISRSTCMRRGSQHSRSWRQPAGCCPIG